jgi:hypothetical protein
METICLNCGRILTNYEDEGRVLSANFDSSLPHREIEEWGVASITWARCDICYRAALEALKPENQITNKGN